MHNYGSFDTVNLKESEKNKNKKIKVKSGDELNRNVFIINKRKKKKEKKTIWTFEEKKILLVVLGKINFKFKNNINKNI